MKRNHLLNAFCFPKSSRDFVRWLLERAFSPKRFFLLQGVSLYRAFPTTGFFQIAFSGRCPCFHETRHFLQYGRFSFRAVSQPGGFLPEAVSYGVAFTRRLDPSSILPVHATTCLLCQRRAVHPKHVIVRIAVCCSLNHMFFLIPYVVYICTVHRTRMNGINKEYRHMFTLVLQTCLFWDFLLAKILR